MRWEDQWYDAGFVVWEVDPETDEDRGMVAAARHVDIAKAAFEAALIRLPKSRLVLRRRSMVIDDRLGALARPK